MDKLRFYSVNEDYLQYLKKYERKVPDYKYKKHSKFYCGVVLLIKEYYYFSPVSSFSTQQQTNFLIKFEEKTLSSVRFSFMIPVPQMLLTQIDFSQIEKKHRSLIIKEFDYCNEHMNEIKSKAESIYRKSLVKNSFFAKQCCNFKLLERKHDEYIQSVREIELQTIKEIAFTENGSSK